MGKGFVLLAALLAGCALQPRVVSSSQRTVVVEAMDDAIAPAQRLADAECMKQRRFARMKSRPGPSDREFVFDCVE